MEFSEFNFLIIIIYFYENLQNSRGTPWLSNSTFWAFFYSFRTFFYFYIFLNLFSSKMGHFKILTYFSKFEYTFPLRGMYTQLQKSYFPFETVNLCGISVEFSTVPLRSDMPVGGIIP